MGSGQLAVVSQEFDQQSSGLNLMGVQLSVDGERGCGHGKALSVREGPSRREIHRFDETANGCPNQPQGSAQSAEG
jgi:hypothetical protein